MSTDPACLEAVAREAVWQLAAHSAGIGTYLLHLPSRELVVDDQLLALCGLDRSAFTGHLRDLYARIHPDDVADVAARVERSAATGEACTAHHRVQLPDGTTRWLTTSGQTVTGHDGSTTALAGAVYDVTALREATTRVSQVLESMPVGYLALDADWRITHLNDQAVSIMGPREGLLGLTVWDAFPATVGTVVETSYRRAAETGELVTFDAFHPAPLDGWFEVRAAPQVDGLAVYFTDITARHRTQELAQRATDQARRAAQEQTALVGVAQSLSHADTEAEVLAVVAARGLPLVGASAPALRLHDPEGPGGVRVLTTGDAEDASRVSVPLRARGHLLGSLSLGFAPGRSLTAQDRELLQAFAALTALALERISARDAERAASAEVARFSETLQRSLLTSPPEPDHLRIAVRYSPAAATAQVGGDWYDAFLTADGATCVVIGDVTGHDRVAAAAMGQLRNLLRGIGYTVGQPPAAVLSTLDRAVRDLAVDTTATAVLARVEQTDAQRRRGERVLRWSNAGHPPPLLVSPDGTTRYLEGAPDLVLGVDPGTTRHDQQVVLEPGSTVLLYTDGLVERRRAPLQAGLDWLLEAVRDLAHLDVDALCDALLEQVGGQLDDDVALLALRAHPQD